MCKFLLSINMLSAHFSQAKIIHLPICPLSKVEAEVANAKGYRFIRKQVEALQIIIKQKTTPHE